MNKFQLYNNLHKLTKSKPLTKVAKKEFSKNFSKMDKEGHELIYLLIQSYQIDQQVNIELNKNGTDITFDLYNLPNKLQQILSEFLRMHIKKIDEEKLLEQERKNNTLNK